MFSPDLQNAEGKEGQITSVEEKLPCKPNPIKKRISVQDWAKDFDNLLDDPIGLRTFAVSFHWVKFW